MCCDDRSAEVRAQCGRPICEIVKGRPARNERLEETLECLVANLVSLIAGSDESGSHCFLRHDRT